MKDKVEKHLNDAKQYQPCKKMVLLYYSLEAWDYLCMTLVSSGALVMKLRRNNTKKYMHSDLALSSQRVKQSLTLLRIDSSTSLSGARKLFGLTFGIGVRNRAPNKGKPTVSLHHGDVVNLVDVAHNSYDNEAVIQGDHQKEFVSAQGIDFIYNQASRLLKIRMRYTKIEAHKPIVADTLNLSPVPLDHNEMLQQEQEHEQIDPLDRNEILQQEREQINR